MAEAYLARHSAALQEGVSSAVGAAIKARSEQPLLAVGRALLAAAGEDPDEAARLRQEVTELKAELELARKARQAPRSEAAPGA